MIHLYNSVVNLFKFGALINLIILLSNKVCKAYDFKLH